MKDTICTLLKKIIVSLLFLTFNVISIKIFTSDAVLSIIDENIDMDNEIKIRVISHIIVILSILLPVILLSFIIKIEEHIFKISLSESKSSLKKNVSK